MMTGCENGAKTASERRQAFDALVRESRSRIYSRAYRLLQNASEAEDVTQEALIKAWIRFPQFDGRNWDAWMHRIVTNTALSRMETLKRSQRVRANDPTDTATGEELLERLPADVAEQPEHQVVARETEEQLQSAIDALPEEWATVLRLYAFEDCRFDQIAVLLECPPGTVRSRIHRARARLRTLLTDGSGNLEARAA